MDVPYSKYQVVDRPLGLTLPLRRADVEPTLDALGFFTSGLRFPIVANVRSAPRSAPALLVPTKR